MVFQSSRGTRLVGIQLDDTDVRPECAGLTVIIADCCETSLNDCTRLCRTDGCYDTLFILKLRGQLGSA